MKTTSLLVTVLSVSLFACGDDVPANPDAPVPTPDAATPDGAVPDAAPAPDAEWPDAPPPQPAQVWMQGDPLENNRYQILTFIDGEPLPITTPIAFPNGATDGITSSNNNLGDGFFAPFDVSADGTKIAFAADSDVAGQYDLYVADTDGQNVVRAAVMPVDGDVDRVRFSPDGSMVAFRADIDVDNQRDIYMVPADADNGTPIRLSPLRGGAPNADDADFFMWSPDSTWVIMTGEFTDDTILEMWRVDATAGAPAPEPVIDRGAINGDCITGSDGVVGPIYWTAAGRLLFKSCIDPDNNLKLHLVDADGQNLEVLPNSTLPRGDGTDASVGAVGISPDGSMLAYAADVTVDAYEIYLIGTDGAAPATMVTSGNAVAGTGPTFFHPLVFDGDGSMIAFMADYGGVDNKYEPYVAPVAGGGETRLAVIGDPVDAGQDATDMMWVPDGSRIYIVADHLVNNDFELFALDPTLTDQTPTVAYDVEAVGGDLAAVRVVQP